METLPKTNEEIVYEKLRQIILNGELPRGEFLSQRKLAERSEAAVVTVRAALRTLENEGLIENVPRWGVRIPVEDEAALRDRYFMREVLEAAAVARMLEVSSTQHYDTLLNSAKKIDELATETEDRSHVAQVHFEFHQQIAKYSGSPLLIETLERINLRVLMFYNAQYAWAPRFDPGDHVQLVADIFSGDPSLADKATREHVRRGLERELEVRLSNEDGS